LLFLAAVPLGYFTLLWNPSSSKEVSECLIDDTEQASIHEELIAASPMSADPIETADEAAALGKLTQSKPKPTTWISQFWSVFRKLVLVVFCMHLAAGFPETNYLTCAHA